MSALLLIKIPPLVTVLGISIAGVVMLLGLVFITLPSIIDPLNSRFRSWRRARRIRQIRRSKNKRIGPIQRFIREMADTRAEYKKVQDVLRN